MRYSIKTIGGVRVRDYPNGLLMELDAMPSVSACKYLKSQGDYFTGWVVTAPGGVYSDPIPNKTVAAQVMADFARRR